jgi:hypothetical protein
MKPDITTARIEKRQNRAQILAFAFQESLEEGLFCRSPVVNEVVVEGYSLSKKSLYARFGPRSGPKHTVFGAVWSLWSPIRSHCELSADFFNRLDYSPKLRYPMQQWHHTCGGKG